MRFGLKRTPVTTIAVLAITVATNVAQAFVPGLLALWERTPAGRQAESWRTLTALLVQDGGAVGAVSNLAFLTVLGIACEQVLRPWAWLVCYLGAGLAGELAGYRWQPYGAGNSVAVCGLAGALVVALWQRHPDVTRAAGVLVLYWCAGLLASRFPRALVLWVLLAIAAQRPVLRGRLGGRFVAGAAALVALALLLAADVHGAALAAGIVIAAPLAAVERVR